MKFSDKIESILNEEYIESMDDGSLTEAIVKISQIWEKWKKGPATQKSDIKSAKKELLNFIADALK